MRNLFVFRKSQCLNAHNTLNLQSKIFRLEYKIDELDEEAQNNLANDLANVNTKFLWRSSTRRLRHQCCVLHQL